VREIAVPPPAPPAAPNPQPQPPSTHAGRPTPATPGPEAAPRERSERQEALGARCSDLLQRMQIGEPLTPEQSQYFQSRCTR